MYRILVTGADGFLGKEVVELLIQYNFDLKGLMCNPPVGEDPKGHFNTLKNIADNHQLRCLSMGMSNDYEMAIQCGATHIRIGTLIFGERV